MIAILFRLVPDEARPAVRTYVVFLALAVDTRAAACVLLVPVLARLFSDDPGAARPWMAVLVAVVVAHAALQRSLARRGFTLGLDVMAQAQRRVADHLALLPLGWSTGSRRGAARKAMAGTGAEVAQTIGNLVAPLLQALALPVAIAVGLLFVAWPLGVAALVAAPLLVGAWWLGNRCSRRADAEFTESIAELDDSVLEFARAQRVLRGARRADPDRSAAGAALDTQHVATVGLLRWSVPGQLLFSVASQLALLVLAVTALALLRRGEVSVPEAVALLVVVVRFLEPFTTLGELAPALQATTTNLRGIDEVLSAAPLVAERSAGGPEAPVAGAPKPAPEVRFDQVTFRHPGAATTTIDAVDLVAPAGATTAIVGPSGAGKTTLLALVARFHDADGGRVLVDGHDVRASNPEDLYRDLSVVFQDVYLFEGTIGDNVRAGDPDADDERLAEVAALSRVDEIVARLPRGWDTPVGEGGVALSGGERQRVGIARALLKGAPLLLVDEATSALDPENERAVAAALAGSDGTRTTLVVAHRMRTIEQADHVVFVDGGRVVEAGPRAALLAQGGRFARFHDDLAATRTWTLGRG